MIIYRLADKKYVDDREGLGAKLFGGRWNGLNYPCLYASQHMSLALLEKFAHAKFKENMANIAVLEIEIAEEDSIFRVDETKLQKDWSNNISYTQWIGEQILDDLTIVAFSVPSVLVPSERNYIINPRAIDFKKVKFKKVTDFSADYRLLNALL